MECDYKISMTFFNAKVEGYKKEELRLPIILFKSSVEEKNYYWILNYNGNFFCLNDDSYWEFYCDDYVTLTHKIEEVYGASFECHILCPYKEADFKTLLLFVGKIKQSGNFNHICREGTISQ